MTLRSRITTKQWETLKRATGNKCYYCGGAGELEKDHFIARAAGGNDSLENIVPCCRRCNLQKSSSSGSDFFRWLNFLKGVGLHSGPQEFCRQCGRALYINLIGCTCDVS